MRSTNSWLFSLTMPLMVIALLACSSPAPTPTPSPQSFSNTVVVDPDDTVNVPIRVGVSNRVTGELRVQGGVGNDIDFSVTDPSGNIILSADRISGNHSFSFIASADGNYTMNLDNTFSFFSNKAVTYSFTVSWR